MKELTQKMLQPTHVKRTFFFLLCDVFLVAFSLYAAFLLRFEFAIPSVYKKIFFSAVPFFVGIKLLLFGSFGLYRLTWRYVGIGDLGRIALAMFVAEAFLSMLILTPFSFEVPFFSLPYIAGFPRSIFFIDGLLCSLMIAGFRLSKRLYMESAFIIGNKRELGVRTVIVGAGRTGEMILRDVAHRGYADFYPVGLLDDDPKKKGSYLRGVKVLGPTSRLKHYISKKNAGAVIIAIPSLNHKMLREIYDSARKSGLQIVKIVPRIYDYHSPSINLKNLEEISIEDLIGRQTVSVDQAGIEDFIRDKTVLITGAGGSIGSEIVMQICSFNPEQTILFDIDETELHALSLRLKKQLPFMEERCRFVTGDIRDRGRLDEVFAHFRPDIVFHAAAYKHVPMMELNPKEAVKVNVFGTFETAKAASRYGVSKFILISTDKAIKPSSVMGASKRVAECICQAFNNSSSPTEYISVRFGNVLGSRGSALPIFLDQLKHGGPMTITHPDMRRYFMTIPEAVSLVLQASVIGKGGEVLVLDMGEPVKIVTLVEELVRLHGLEPYRDIDIVFTGMRPGEKLFEELLTAEEGSFASRHEKVFIARTGQTHAMDEIESLINELREIIVASPIENDTRIRTVLMKMSGHHISPTCSRLP